MNNVFTTVTALILNSPEKMSTSPTTVADTSTLAVSTTTEVVKLSEGYRPTLALGSTTEAVKFSEGYQLTPQADKETKLSSKSHSILNINRRKKIVKM